MKLKQIGMRAGTLENNFTLHIVNFIDKHPITLNMTFKRFFPFALKRVVMAFRRQGLFVGNAPVPDTGIAGSTKGAARSA